MTNAEFSQALGAMDPTELALGAGAVGIVVTLMFVFSIVWHLLSAIGFYKMYKKANARAWMAFVPLLHQYTAFKISWNVKAFVISIVLMVVSRLAGNSESIAVLLLSFAASIALIVVQVKMRVRLAKSFGKSAGWGVLLLFFPFIISLILGFGKAEYVGNVSAAPAVEAAVEE